MLMPLTLLEVYNSRMQCKAGLHSSVLKLWWFKVLTNYKLVLQLQARACQAVRHELGPRVEETVRFYACAQFSL